MKKITILSGKVKFQINKFLFLETPIPSQNCPRQNGYFAHDDDSICDKFFYCVDGKYNMIECPAGLVFNPKVGICTWADEAKRKGCGTDDVFQFRCPKHNETYSLTHPRYADPDGKYLLLFFYYNIFFDIINFFVYRLSIFLRLY